MTSGQTLNSQNSSRGKFQHFDYPIKIDTKRSKLSNNKINDRSGSFSMGIYYKQLKFDEKLKSKKDVTPPRKSQRSSRKPIMIKSGSLQNQNWCVNIHVEPEKP